MKLEFSREIYPNILK